MKYLRKFNNQSAYNTAKSGENFWYPCVSLLSDSMDVVYDDEEPAPAHPYVEIGGVKWATMNLGAESITDAGLYFQWGDTQGYTASQVGSGEGKKAFSWTDYKYYEGATDSWAEVIKYNLTDGKTLLEPSDDAAYTIWGGNWKIPSVANYTALYNAVNTVWTNDYLGSGVAGAILTDKLDNSKVLFIPGAKAEYDFYEGSRILNDAVVNWTNTVCDSYYTTDDYFAAFCLCINQTGWHFGRDEETVINNNFQPRYVGAPIRAIFVGQND